MQLLATTLAPLVAFFAAMPAPALAQAVTCEVLRQTVESKIRGKGVAGFTIQVVDATTKPQGQVVGTCDRGAKKLVYLKVKESVSSANQARPPAQSGATPGANSNISPIITECADGRVIISGNCLKQ